MTGRHVFSRWVGVVASGFLLAAAMAEVVTGNVPTAWADAAPQAVTPYAKIASARVGEDQTNCLQAYVRGPDNNVWQTVQGVPGGNWGPWAKVGDSVAGDVVVAQNKTTVDAAAHLLLFVRGSDNTLRYSVPTTYCNQAGTVTWTTDTGLATSLNSDPAVGAMANDDLAVFVVDSNKHLRYKTQSSPGSPNWTKWKTLGTPKKAALVGNPVLGADINGALRVFVRADNGALWTRGQLTPNGKWGPWFGMGKAPAGTAFGGDPAVARNALPGPQQTTALPNGRLQVFMRGDDNNLYTKAESTPGSGQWSSPWQLIKGAGGTASDPVVTTNTDGRLELFAVGTQGGVYHTAQVNPGYNDWTPAQGLNSQDGFGGGFTGKPAVGMNADGRVAVFAQRSDGTLSLLAQNTPGGLAANDALTDWGGWENLGAGASPCVSPGTLACLNITNVETGALLTPENGDQDPWVDQTTASTGSQLWTLGVQKAGSGTFTLTNQATNECLNVRYGVGYGWRTNETPCDGTAKLWNLELADPAQQAYRITEASDPSHCVFAPSEDELSRAGVVSAGVCPSDTSSEWRLGTGNNSADGALALAASFGLDGCARNNQDCAFSATGSPSGASAYLDAYQCMSGSLYYNGTSGQQTAYPSVAHTWGWTAQAGVSFGVSVQVGASLGFVDEKVSASVSASLSFAWTDTWTVTNTAYITVQPGEYAGLEKNVVRAAIPGNWTFNKTQGTSWTLPSQLSLPFQDKQIPNAVSSGAVRLMSGKVPPAVCT